MNEIDPIMGNLRFAITQAGAGGTVTLTAETAGKLLAEIDRLEAARVSLAERHQEAERQLHQGIAKAKARIERLTAELAASRPTLTEVPGVVFDVLDKVRAFVAPFVAEPHDERGHLAETSCRTCYAEAMIAEIEGAEAECHLAEKGARPTLTEEQAREELRTVLGRFFAMTPTTTAAVDALVPILRASRGETSPAHDPRATLHAGDPASLAEVVAASAREPHADVVLHALHVSGGAAAVEALRDPRIDYSTDMRPAVTGGECARCLHAPPLHEATCPTLRRPWCLKCNTPVETCEIDNGLRLVPRSILDPVGVPVHGDLFVRVVCHGETFERTYTAAEVREHGMPPMAFFGPVTSCPDSSLLGFGAALLAGKTPRSP